MATKNPAKNSPMLDRAEAKAKYEEELRKIDQRELKERFSKEVKSIAEYVKTAYDAYVSVGFTSEEAFMLVTPLNDNLYGEPYSCGVKGYHRPMWSYKDCCGYTHDDE